MFIFILHELKETMLLFLLDKILLNSGSILTQD